MTSGSRHFKNAIYHFDLVRKALNSYRNVLECLKKDSVKVMDVGCGSGGILMNEVLPALPKNFSEIVGVDKNQFMLDHCKLINVDPRVSFEHLDISVKDIPTKFVEKYDLITSFYCLHYLNDYEQMLQNMHTMLKPNGELFYVQVLKQNPMLETYRELGKIESWKPYFSEYETYKPPFLENDPQTELRNVFERSDLKLVQFEFEDIRMKAVAKNFIETFKALDTKQNAIPADKKKEYIKDFHQCFSKVENFDYVNEKSLNRIIEKCFYQVTVYARKPSYRTKS